MDVNIASSVTPFPFKQAGWRWKSHCCLAVDSGIAGETRRILYDYVG
jgi:hypothetical protein